MIKELFITLLFLVSMFFGAEAQEKQIMRLTFVGDVMGHGTQIKAAYVDSTKSYDYDFMFEKIKPLFEDDDYTIANLEVTLAGPPYTGYPQFGSPDELAIACKRNGIDAFVTANNHSCDRRRKGIDRTIKVLDSLAIPHTGTFNDQKHREENNLMILEKGDIKVGVLNYTYGTNGIPIPKPTVVNLLDTTIISKDIVLAKQENLDKLIVFTHWGYEYHFHPNRDQVNMANFLLKKGVDIVIGSHPHVIQRCEYSSQTESKETVLFYSLGNFVSNMRSKGCDGGMVATLTIEKEGEKIRVVDPRYHLVWVHKVPQGKKTRFQVVEATEAEATKFAGMNAASKTKMEAFILRSRTLLDKENKQVKEGRFPLSAGIKAFPVRVYKVSSTAGPLTINTQER